MNRNNFDILVTGSTGFIGQYIIEKFNKNKINVLSSYNKKKIKSSKYIKPIKINMKKLNFSDLKKYKVKTLIHLAWPKLNDFEDKSHTKDILKNQKKFLKTIIKLGCKNIIVAGSSLEYGLKSGKNVENQITKPVCSYGIAKDRLRKYLQKLKIKYDFKYTWLRIFFIYGINPNRNTLTNLLVKNPNRKPIILHKKIKRDYVDIKYVSDIFFKIYQKNCNFGVVNLSSGKNISLKKLVSIIKSKFQVKPNVLYKVFEQRKYEPERFYGCNKKLKYIIGNKNV